MSTTLTWPGGTVYRITRSSEETGGRELEMEWELPAAGWAPEPHVHPNLTEEYEALDGSLEILVGREWRQLEQGEHASVPPGTAHTQNGSSAYRQFSDARLHEESRARA